MRKSFAAWALSFLLCACAPGASRYPHAEERAVAPGRPAVIFLHGYYGSALRAAGAGPTKFLTPWQTLYGSLPIALRSRELGLRDSPALEVQGLMGTITVLPYLYSLEVYSSLLTRLAGKERQAIPFAYDWRGDLPTAARSLHALIESLHAQGVTDISLAAHSMGGLVTAYYLAYGAQDPATAKLDWRGARKVARVIFFGTPFRGAMGILKNFQYGTGYAWNQDLLEAGTVASFPASYQLLPLLDPLFRDPKGVPQPWRLSQPEAWREWRLGYWREPAENGAVQSAREAYAKAELLRAAEVSRLIQAEGATAPASLKVLNVVGEGRPTSAYGVVNSSAHEIYLRERELEKQGLSAAAAEADGDGSVTLASAALPAAYRAQGRELRTHFSHEQVFLDPAVEREYARFLGGR